MEDGEKLKAQPKMRVLCLDGGGSKGFFSLGALSELEAKLGGGTLSNHFDLIYGTSTGAIIAALLADGRKVADIKTLYEKFVLKVLGNCSRSKKSRVLREVLNETFEDKSFLDLNTDLGIVAANFETMQPTIFKSNVKMAHGLRATFLPGFGAKISDAVCASCSAYPFFAPVSVNTKNQGTMLLVDGGFVANNPSLFALIDVQKAMGTDLANVSLISVGVGRYQEKFSFSTGVKSWLHFLSRDLLGRLFSFNANTMTVMFRLFGNGLKVVRIDAEFSERELKTSLFETDLKKLERIFAEGRKAFGSVEKEIQRVLFEPSEKES